MSCLASQGRIRHSLFSEGEGEIPERTIEKPLRDAGRKNVSAGAVLP